MTPVVIAYRAKLTPDRDGSLTVRFPEFTEALTSGVDKSDALKEARDCLNTAILARIHDGEAIPLPVAARRDEFQVAPFALGAYKLALHWAMKDAGTSPAELARRMDIDHKEARRLLDPYEATKIQRLEEALACLERETVVTLRTRKAEGVSMGRGAEKRQGGAQTVLATEDFAEAMASIEALSAGAKQPRPVFIVASGGTLAQNLRSGLDAIAGRADPKRGTRRGRKLAGNVR